MSEKELSKEQITKITKALERIVNDLPWGQSIFLSALGKKFEKIRDDFIANTNELNEQNDSSNNSESERLKLAPNQKNIFVSVYNAQGNDIGLWARVIHNLTNQFVSRPMYSKETEVKEMIRSKLNIVNEGYLSVYVYETDIIEVTADRHPKDKLGHSLLLLKERVISKDNIKMFYHESGIYEYKEGIMSKVGDMTFANE